MTTPTSDLNRASIVEKLNGTHYGMWKIKIEMLLIRNDCFSVINGTYPDPGPGDPVLQGTWKVKDDKARADLILHCGNAQIQLVRSLTTAKAVWDKLQSTYELTDLASQVSIYKRLL